MLASMILAVALASPCVSSGSGSPAQPAVEGQAARSPAHAMLEQYLEAMNAGTPEAIRRFESTHRASAGLRARSMEDRIAQAGQLRGEWGRLTLREIVSTEAGPMTAVVETERRGMLELTFELDPTEPGKLRAIVIQPAAGPAGPLDAAAMRQAVEALAAALATQYVFPEKGEEMAGILRRALAEGKYAGVRTDRELAERLTRDLQAICGDKHLRVRGAPLAQRPAGGASGPMMRRPANAGFRKVEVLEDNIGYLRLDGFEDSDEARRIAAAAMNFIASCDAVIFDMRYNGGGSPAMVRYITSWLFEEPVHLNSMYDRGGNVVSEYWTLEDVPGRRLGEQAPVYVLTSRRTFSGAEEFSYNLQALGRGTIVGETTGGGAHPVQTVRLGEGFIATIPFMRANNPVTQTNWEGVGVKPDIECPEENALERTLEEIRAGR
jgi:retinol-binding protein 3